LTAEQIKDLEGAVAGYFDYIERIIKRRQTFTMDAFAKSVDAFLSFNEYKLLEDGGTISREQADEKAWAAYEVFNKHQVITSDFDRQLTLYLEEHFGAMDYRADEEA
jgi:hypothetical protein